MPRIKYLLSTTALNNKLENQVTSFEEERRKAAIQVADLTAHKNELLQEINQVMLREVEVDI